MYLVRAIYGFKETPNALKVIDDLKAYDIECESMDTSYFLARDSVIPSAMPGMAIWREKIFAWMHQNAAKPSDFYQIPTNRVVELGAKIEI
jgi:KUP system potassium uptake protein